MNRNFFPLQYLAYLLRAKNAHGIHSAFVYELYHKVLASKENYYDFAPIEFLRNKLLHSTETIDVIDFGAGGPGTKKRRVREIVQTTSVKPKYGKMLFRLVNFMQPHIMVEMGTSLGISTVYQAKACPEATLITMEGSPATAALAIKNFELLKATNIKLVLGDFKETLPKVLDSMNKVDYVFFDGNHKKEATLEYFKRFADKASDNAVFVFDDIRWSAGMAEAWNGIKKDERLTVTVDIFFMGLAFFRKGQVKEHFVLRF